MSANHTIWVVEKGDYSDYQVVGVFSSRENAQLVADAINKDDPYDKATVDEWPLDPVVGELSHGRRPFLINMLRDGTVERCDQTEVSAFGIRHMLKPEIWRSRTVQDCLLGEFWGVDAQHAIKIANEKRAQMIARGEWD